MNCEASSAPAMRGCSHAHCVDKYVCYSHHLNLQIQLCETRRTRTTWVVISFHNNITRPPTYGTTHVRERVQPPNDVQCTQTFVVAATVVLAAVVVDVLVLVDAIVVVEELVVVVDVLQLDDVVLVLQQLLVVDEVVVVVVVDDDVVIPKFG